VCGGYGGYLLSVSQQRGIGRFWKYTIKNKIHRKSKQAEMKWLLLLNAST